MHFLSGVTSFGSLQKSCNIGKRKEPLQKKQKASPSFAKFSEKTWTKGKKAFWRYKNQRHKCHLTTNCYKSRAFRTVLAYMDSPTKRTNNNTRHLRRRTWQGQGWSYDVCKLCQCIMSWLYASSTPNSMIHTSIEKIVKRKLKQTRRNGPCTTAEKTHNSTWQIKATIHINTIW